MSDGTVLSMAEIMAKKKAVTKKATIQLDGEVATELEQLEEALIEAQHYDRHHNEADTAPAIEKRIEELTEASKDTLVTFEFKSIGREAYDLLVEAHPPLAKHKKEGAGFNSDTFPPVLIAESCVSPEMTVEEATEMFNSETWNGTELLRLFYTAYGVNNETGEIPKSRSGSGMTSSSLVNSLMQLSEASPTQSS